MNLSEMTLTMAVDITVTLTIKVQESRQISKCLQRKP